MSACYVQARSPNLRGDSICCLINRLLDIAGTPAAFAATATKEEAK